MQTILGPLINKLGLLTALGISLLAFSSPARAAGDMTGKVQFVDASNNYVFLKMASSYAGKPACSTDPNWDFAIPTTNQPAIAIALSARVSGTSVRVTGTGVCSLYPQVEDMFFIYE